MDNFEIIFYEKEDGTKPIEIFLDSLDVKMRTKMLITIAMLKNNGTNLREPYSKPLNDGIFELRAKSGNNITRILYFFVIGQKIILTNGFVKKTQKTPVKELNKAKEYRKDYLQRKENKENG